jgi:hypothetical protein
VKKLLFLFVILFSSISVAQWRYSEKEIEFDGIYEVDEDSFLVKDSDIEVRKR